MAKFEITLTGDTWIEKTTFDPKLGVIATQLDEDPIKAALRPVKELVEVDVDLDEVDHTDLMANWEITVTAEFECANGEEDEIAGKAGAALRHAGLKDVTWDMEEEDYPMPEHEIIESFRDNVLPNVPNQNDRIAKWEAFQFHVDSLQKRGMITEWQAEHIDNPWSKDMP
jgi:hypothetical protein